MSRGRKNYRANAIGFGLAGLFLIGSSQELVRNETGVFFTGECVEDTVVDTETHKSSPIRRSKRFLSEHAIIAYTTGEGRPMRKTAPISCRVGERVRVYYDTTSPSRMRVLSLSALTPLLFPLVGLGLLSISLILVLRSSPKK